MTLSDIVAMPLFPLLLAATAVLLLDRYLPARRITTWAALAGPVIAAALSPIAFASGQGSTAQGMLAQDGAALLATMFLCGVGGAAILLDAVAGRVDGGRLALGLFAILGGAAVVWATHLLSALIGLGIMYVAVGTRMGQRQARPYLLLHGAGLACTLMGIALLYGGAGSMRFDVLIPRLGRQVALGVANPLARTGLGLIAGSASLGLGLAPFHGWLPLVCRGARRGDGVWLSLGIPGTLTVLLFRLRESYSPHALDLLTTLGAWSVIIGYISALRSPNLRAALAGLTTAQSGRLAAALALGTPPALLFYHLFAGSLALLLLWTTTNDAEGVQVSTASGGIADTRATFTALALISLGGAMPLPGGVSNHLLWQAAWTRGQVWNATLLPVGGAIAWLFAGRWTYKLWLQPPTPGVPSPMPVERTVLALAITTLLLLGGVLALPVLERLSALLAVPALTS